MMPATWRKLRENEKKKYKQHVEKLLEILARVQHSQPRLLGYQQQKPLHSQQRTSSGESQRAFPKRWNTI